MSITVVMPAYNEASGIVDFICEMQDSLKEWAPHFIVVDDASTDETAVVLRAARGSARSAITSLEVVNNPHNMGHGPSTLSALRKGLKTEAEIVIAIDGDGQFSGPDVAEVARTLLMGSFDVVEGVRTERGDALYRRLTSQVTRILVWSRCGVRPRDANTPLRAYRPSVLQSLVNQVPADAMTPNLLISVLSRRRRMAIGYVDVASRARRGPNAHGSTWGSRRKSLPSRRFLAFCLKASVQWVRQ